MVSAHTKHREVKMDKKWKPGEQVPETGDYAAYDREGSCGGSTFLEKGKRFPATQHEGSYYVKED